jgi:hypothetical protein
MLTSSTPVQPTDQTLSVPPRRGDGQLLLDRRPHPVAVLVAAAPRTGVPAVRYGGAAAAAAGPAAETPVPGARSGGAVAGDMSCNCAVPVNLQRLASHSPKHTPTPSPPTAPNRIYPKGFCRPVPTREKPPPAAGRLRPGAAAVRAGRRGAGSPGVQAEGHRRREGGGRREAARGPAGGPFFGGRRSGLLKNPTAPEANREPTELQPTHDSFLQTSFSARRTPTSWASAAPSSGWSTPPSLSCGSCWAAPSAGCTR